MLNWDEIDLVYLDMDGTLLDLHYDNHFWLDHLPRRYAQITGQDVDAIRRDLEDRYQRMRGTLDWYCLEYWQEALQLDIMQLKREVADRIQWRPSAREFLATLRELGKPAALVSNSHPWGIELKMEMLDLGLWFDQVYSSHQFQQPKEAREFWEQLHAETRFDPLRTLFIDDNERVLDSAADYGIRHLYSIHEPDLRAGAQPQSRYPQLMSFDELFVEACSADN